MPDLYDLIIIGTGAGGGTLAHELAGTGKRILLLERGGYLPREQENWSSEAVFVDNRYKSHETWHDGNGRPFQPGIHYFVGGNTKFYGAVLLRLRERDFEAVQHRDGISPAWPLSYRDFAPYYCGPSPSTRCMVNGALIRPKHPKTRRTRGRLLRTSRACRNWPTICGARDIIRFRCRSVSGSMSAIRSLVRVSGAGLVMAFRAWWRRSRTLTSYV
jgi:hypothetical protein